MSSQTPLLDRLKREIDSLHDFFVDWFTGNIQESDENFNMAEGTMDESFHLINPEGVLTKRSDLISALKKAYGCRNDQVFTIQCRNIQILRQVGDNVLCSYEEWQTVGKTETARMVSAWFLKHSDDKLTWLHVHETWLPGKAPPSDKDMWKPAS